MAGLVDEMDFSTTASKVGDGEEVSAEVRDVEDVLQDACDPFAFGIHPDANLSRANGWDAAVIAKYDFSLVRERAE